MSKKTNGNKGGYGRLNKKIIVDVAVALADEVGMAGISMAAVAARAGASPMALYRHVDNKDDLINAMVGNVIAEIELAEDDDWEVAIHSMAVSMYAALIRHPWVGPFMLNISDWRAILPFLSLISQHLKRGGVSVVNRSYVVHALYIHVCAQATRDSVVLPAAREVIDVEARISNMEAAGHRVYAELIEHLPTTPREGESELRFVIDALLAHAQQLQNDG